MLVQVGLGHVVLVSPERTVFCIKDTVIEASNKIVEMHLCLLLLLGVLSSALAEKVLILVQDQDITSTHSTFIDYVRTKNYEVDIHVAGESVKLKDYDRWLYDHLILLAPRAKSKSCALA